LSFVTIQILLIQIISPNCYKSKAISSLFRQTTLRLFQYFKNATSHTLPSSGFVFFIDGFSLTRGILKVDQIIGLNPGGVRTFCEITKFVLLCLTRCTEMNLMLQSTYTVPLRDAGTHTFIKRSNISPLRDTLSTLGRES